MRSAGLVLAALMPAVALAVTPPAVESVEVAMLSNLRDQGHNPEANNGLGGLWINWRTGANPPEVNFNGSGRPDGATVVPPRHDVLTDFRYLHNLLSWKHQHPADHAFDAEADRYTRIVQREFAHTHNERGWIYDELIDMGRLSGDAWFRNAARELAEFYASQVHEDIGTIYKATAAQPRGHYRVDLVLESGCALVQAGTVFQRPDWVAKGERVVDFVYQHAYLRPYHLFLTQMDEVRLPDGTANPNETIYRQRTKNYLSDGGVVRFGGIGGMVLSLLHTAVVTRDSKWLDRAEDLLDPLTAERNECGLWDRKEGGYFNGVAFDGPDFRHAGTPRRLDEIKEAGRQFHLLQAFHVANRLAEGRYRGMETAMLETLLHRAYVPEARGIYYEVKPDWSPRMTKRGPENWVTSEAMGCAMLALFSLDEPEPW